MGFIVCGSTNNKSLNYSNERSTSANKNKSFRMKKYIVFILLNTVVWLSFAQEGTRNTQTATPVIEGKIIIVPFEPKLYMSEIDGKVNQQTNWKFDKIREHFRQQLNNQLKSKLQNLLPVVSFYSDSAKMAKDLMYVYKSSTLTYDLVSEQHVKSTPDKQTPIKNGQLAVEISTDKKFMNTKITDPDMLDYIHKKYKVNYFLFINQLDIVNNPDSYDMVTDSYQRDVTMHYTVIDKFGKNILAGTSVSHFSSKENEPKKIVGLSFTPIASDVTTKLTKILKPKNTGVQKK